MKTKFLTGERFYDKINDMILTIIEIFDNSYKLQPNSGRCLFIYITEFEKGVERGEYKKCK